MDLVSALVTAAVFPWACLGFVLWMGRLEDDLPGAVQRAERRPDPPPVLTISVATPIPTQLPVPVQVPGQRRPEGASPAVVVEDPATVAVQRPVEPSIG